MDTNVLLNVKLRCEMKLSVLSAIYIMKFVK